MQWINTNHPDVPVDVDIAYAGATTAEDNIELDYSNIASVFFSLSKSFGVYRDRTGGVFSREEIPGLYGNKWFNNAISLLMGERLIEKYEPCQLPKKYRDVQEKVVSALSQLLGEDVLCSDVPLIGHSPTASVHPNIIKPFQRAHGMRYCLTPAIDKAVKG